MLPTRGPKGIAGWGRGVTSRYDSRHRQEPMRLESLRFSRAGTLGEATSDMRNQQATSTTQEEALPAKRPVVMLTLDEGRTPFVALDRAITLARKLSSDLLVVGAVASGERVEERTRAQLVRLMSRLDLLVVPHGIEIVVRQGAPCEVAVSVGKAADPVLVVMNPSNHTAGGLATAVSDALGRPVLVARDPVPEGHVVVATDMLDLRYPVLSRCRPLAQALRRSATFVHNAPATCRLAAPLEATRSDVSANWLAQIAADAKLARLQTLAAEAGDDVEAVVVRSDRTVDAILEVANGRNADVVAVGHPIGSGRLRLRSHHTSERIVEHCRRSVLVIPFEREVRRAS
ncbi:MAG: universal stress protein [Deltaproteobacteria bacterium]|nr:universal stress protein [Deltaproteobacteria bacterium]